ncbi:hypothetical protein NDU88_007429 [Pleurodeles waltl]|uniref:Uncharacterized protein n=1 Tax=Pleurodeles waltl TaxID=8319 RepID=A0AAV7MIP2_PLEWA|nr:hypothetical protein NDU88_007429 [Pleurodeles waltl]
MGLSGVKSGSQAQTWTGPCHYVERPTKLVKMPVRRSADGPEEWACSAGSGIHGPRAACRPIDTGRHDQALPVDHKTVNGKEVGAGCRILTRSKAVGYFFLSPPTMISVWPTRSGAWGVLICDAGAREGWEAVNSLRPQLRHYIAWPHGLPLTRLLSRLPSACTLTGRTGINSQSYSFPSVAVTLVFYSTPQALVVQHMDVQARVGVSLNAIRS